MPNKPVKRGLTMLLANIEDETKNRPMPSPQAVAYTPIAVPEGDDLVLNAPVEQISPDANQPRKRFKDDTLRELAESIKNHGIIQPLVVKRLKNGNYQIIAGERRYRAAIIAGLSEVPVIVRELSDLKAREISLIENLQREDLNPIEEAEAMKELMLNYKLTQEDIAQKLGKARPSIANTLRLLNLPEKVQELLRNDSLSQGHARAILGLPNPSIQTEYALRAATEGWSVRQTEKEVRYFVNPDARPIKMTERVREKLTSDLKSFVVDASRVFSAKVKLIGNETKGRIMIDYENNDQLLKIYETINKLK
jgi:ParB family chromosome partitioning protein